MKVENHASPTKALCPSRTIHIDVYYVLVLAYGPNRLLYAFLMKTATLQNALLHLVSIHTYLEKDIDDAGQG
jgi:hypothetical protein